MRLAASGLPTITSHLWGNDSEGDEEGNNHDEGLVG